MKQLSSILLLTLSILVLNSEPARILAIIPSASYSHQVFYHQLWRELALRGHDMVVVTTDPTNETLPHFKEISIAECYVPMKEIVEWLINSNFLTMFLDTSAFELFMKFAEFQLNLPQMQALIHNKEERFDLLMVEHQPSAILGFKHLFGCPMIGLTSYTGFAHAHEVMGNPTHALLYPMMFLPQHENLNFLQRVVAVVYSGVYRVMGRFSVDAFDQLTRKYFGEETPSLMDLYESTDMFFENASPLFSAVRPYTPSTINIAGGIHMKPLKELPKDLKEFLDNAQEGVVYFSFGSNVKSKDLPKEMQQIIMEAFAQIPYKILWKFEEEPLENLPRNVKTVRWAPQQDVLRHKNVKAFVTQGGIQSLEESIYSKVPVVVMPFFGDQQTNAEKILNKQFGLVLDRYNLNAEDIKSKILEVLENPIYRRNVEELTMKMLDEPMKPLEKAIWWTEYVLRHKGAQHLKGPKIPEYQYYYLDIIGFLIALVICLVGIIYVVFRVIAKLLRKAPIKIKSN